MHLREWFGSWVGESIQWKVSFKKEKVAVISRRTSIVSTGKSKSSSSILFILGSKRSRNYLSGSDGTAGSTVVSLLLSKEHFLCVFCHLQLDSLPPCFALHPHLHIFPGMFIVYSSIFCHACFLFCPPGHDKAIYEHQFDWKCNSPTIVNLLLIGQQLWHLRLSGLGIAL